MISKIAKTVALAVAAFGGEKKFLRKFFKLHFWHILDLNFIENNF